MRIGFYAGSFDPMTNGHLDVLVQALAICDRIVIGVGVSPTKKPMFSFKEREEMIVKSLADAVPARSGDVSVQPFSDLTVTAARNVGATLIIRGLRDGTDFDYEMQLAGMNAEMAAELQTVFLPARAANRHITATLVRQIASMGGDVSPFVPKPVDAAIRAQREGD
jgi:pantetheine-phosphate adenylyltransferase